MQAPITTPISVNSVRAQFPDPSDVAKTVPNTTISTVAQLAFGAEIVCSFLYAQEVLDQDRLGFPENYGWLMASLGLGSVIGGLVIGGFATRARKGPLTISGFVLMGAAMIAAGLVTNPYVAIGLFFLIGAANMLYLVPTITLFQERTPQRLFGRVVSTRQALTLPRSSTIRRTSCRPLFFC